MAKQRNAWQFETVNTRRADEILWWLKEDNIAHEVGYRYESGKRVWIFRLKPTNTQVSRTMQIIEHTA